MAGPFYVDDGGDGSDGLSWATAYTSINALDAAVALASGEIVYFGHDSQCQATNSANLTITGPASGAPVIFISATQGSDPPTYQQGTSNQIDTSEGAYSVNFDGSFALYGVVVNSGSFINFQNDSDEKCYTENCIYKPAATSNIRFGNGDGNYFHINPVVDLSNDSGGSAVYPFYLPGGLSNIEIKGLSFTSATNRTGSVISSAYTQEPVNAYISGADFSGFTNATLCEIVNVVLGQTIRFVGCKTASTWGAVTGNANSYTYVFINCGSTDQPVSLMKYVVEGNLVSSSSIYRTSGATIESTNTAWLITTNAVCTKDSPFYSEYIYGVISSTGSKTFDLYVTNDTADLNNDEIWLEVEYKADASSGKWTLITDKPADRTTAAAAQTDDTTSTWNGTGPSFTYKQKLSVTATVNTTGQYRARVAVGKASIASSAFLYIDPLVTVS